MPVPSRVGARPEAASRALRRAAVCALWVSLLSPATVLAQRDHDDCTRAPLSDMDFIPCLAGEAGPLTPAERDALLVQLRGAATDHWDRLVQALWSVLLLPVVDRAPVLDVFVEHGLPRAAADRLLAIVDLRATIASLSRQVRRRDRAHVRAIEPIDCRIQVDGATDAEVVIVCDHFLQCGPRECMETHAVLRFALTVSGPRIDTAGARDAPSGGGCGCCLGDF